MFLIKKLQALSQWADRFFTLWLQYGLSNTMGIFNSIITKKEISIKFPFGNLYYNAESVGASIYHIINSFAKIQKIVKAIPLKDCKVIFDLGANCGHFSVFASEKYPYAKIYAFEPSPYLEKTMLKNINQRNIVLDKTAIAEKEGEMEFYIHKDSQQANSLIKENVTFYTDKVEAVKVKTQTLDKIAEQYGVNEIDVMKIDCQGAESMILRGATHILTKTRCLILEISLHDDGVEDLLKLVKAHFPFQKIINPVDMGADILFSKEEF